MEHEPLLQRFLRDLEGPAWIAKRVEVLPGIVDSEIIYVTPAMERLYGYVWPDTLVGHHISAIHQFEEAQITRQYALLRHWGFEAPRHYVMHGLHPNGRRFRVIKHVAQYTVDSLTVWVTHHEPWHRSAPYPFVMPLRLSALRPEAIRAFTGDISVAHVQRVGPLLRETASLEAVLARLRMVDAAQATPALQRTVRAALATLPTLGPCLQQARHAQHLSLQAVALRCTALLGQAVTPQHLSNLEQGQRLPSLPLFHALATVLPLEHAAPEAVPAAASRPEAPGARAPRRASEDMLAHVQDAAQHVTDAQQAYRAALTAAHQAGCSFRQLAAVCGRSPSRIRQLVGASPSAPAP